MPNVRRRARSVRVFIALIGLFGLLLVWLGVRTALGQYAIMHRWPKANALVLSSELAHRASRTSRNTPTTIYWPVVRLKYTVGGKQYVTLAGYAAKSNIRSDWQPVVADLKPGTYHLLPYNPENPADVQIGAKWNLAHLGLAVMLVLFGGVFLLLALVGLLSRPAVVASPKPTDDASASAA